MEKRTLIRRQLNHGIARSPILIFLTTFAIVVVAGVSAMLLYMKHSEDTVTMSGEENREETEQEGEHVLDALWESIPEETVEEGNGAAGGKYDDILSDPEYMKANRIYEKQGKKEGVISFGFAGDILFDDEHKIYFIAEIPSAEIAQAIFDHIKTFPDSIFHRSIWTYKDEDGEDDEQEFVIVRLGENYFAQKYVYLED